MFEKSKQRKQKFKENKNKIKEDIRTLVFNHKNFAFSSKDNKQSFLAEKQSPGEISDIESEEFMLRFFGLFQQKSKLGKWIKIVVFAGIVAFAYFNWDKVQLYFSTFIGNIPFISNTLGFVLESLNQKILIGIFLLSFFVNLFFISFPDEIYFISYLLAGHNPLILIPIIVLGGLLGLTVDYIIGRILGVILLRKLLKKKYYQFKFASDKWGALFLVLGTMVPSPVQWFAVALGSFNYSYGRFIFFCAIGKFAKYIGLFYGLNYYTNTLNPFLDESVKPSMEALKQCLNQTNTTLPFVN